MSASPRIVVLGREPDARRPVVRALTGAGFAAVTGAPALNPELPCLPEVLVLSGADAAALCREARQVPVLVDLPILVVAPVAADPAPLLAAGADDLLRPAAEPAEIATRVRVALARGRERAARRELDDTRNALLRIQGLMAAGGDAPDVLREVLLVAQDTLGFDRASLIAHVEGSPLAYVIAATDDPSHSQFTLSIEDYPELAEAIRTGRPVLIDDVRDHPVTAGVGQELAARGVLSLGVFPVLWKGRPLGAVLLRRPEVGVRHLSAELVGFAHLFGHQLAAQLRDSSVFERLRDQTRRISRASYEGELRLRTIESLKEYFEASADGIFVVDETGSILFVNGTAETLTGFARDGLVGASLGELVPTEQRAGLDEVIGAVIAGNNLQAFDLVLRTTSDRPITVSVTTSTVLAVSSAAILSFRDVSAQRRLEAELQHTKDFLENLIDSVVDAVVAADLRGQVILFNKGAERLFGHRAEDVIGRLAVWDLYPDGVANQVMRMLRSSSYGGIGRLKQTRREVLTGAGELVPVNMTASILYEDGQEVASVGIFSDLRERIRIEQRLLQAQEKLEMQERQAMVAELAGAAAHELNQPLTSIIGYAQLIQRRSQQGAEHLRAVDTILSEAERMAGIVKKIGRITRYETVEYVGGASIVDLDRSAASSSSDLPIVQGTEDEPTAKISIADLQDESGGAVPTPIGEGDEDDEDDVTTDPHGHRIVD